MSANVAPNIVRAGLIFDLDAANQKSYVSGSTVWNDLSPNLITGSLVNGPTYSLINGGNIQFDGIDDFISLGKPTSLNILSNITINSWVNVTAWPYFIATIYDNGYDGIAEQTFFRFRNSSGLKIDFGTYKQSILTNYMTEYDIGSTISLNTWNNIVGQYNDGNWNIYLNGVLVSQTFNNQPPLISTAPISIGAAYIINKYERFLNGKISIIQIYNRALSAAEVLQNYNALKGRFGL